MDTNTRDNNIQKEKARIIPKGSFIFCLLVGIIGLGIATFCHIGVANGKRTHLKTDAVVTSAGDTVLVDYTYDGLEFKNKELYAFNTPSVGDHITIYLDKEDYETPINYAISSQIALIFTISGAVFFLAGLAGLIIRHNVMGDVDMIVEGGKYIYVDVDRVVYETSVTDENGRHPFVLYCHYEDFHGKRKHDYVLNDIYDNPNAYLAAHKNKLKLYIKGKNYRKYRFDPEVLKEL